MDAMFEEGVLICPNCDTELSHFDDFGYDFEYCPKCMDAAYSDKGEHLGRME